MIFSTFLVDFCSDFAVLGVCCGVRRSERVQSVKVTTETLPDHEHRRVVMLKAGDDSPESKCEEVFRSLIMYRFLG